MTPSPRPLATLRRPLSALYVLAACALTTLPAAAAHQPTQAAPASGESHVSAARTSASYDHAAVAADHALASQAGAEILRKGGNAVDAAVAVSFTLSVVRPESCGIGGGGFMIIHLHNDPRFGTLTTAINYREQCPSAIDAAYYTRPENADPDASTRGGKSVAVPGTVAGLLYALDKYGTLDRAAVMAPAIKAAREGYLADEHTVASARAVRSWFEKDPTRPQRFAFTWETLTHAGALAVGDRITLPQQARALQLIADRGAGAFYFGDIAQAIIAAVSDDGGPLRAEDLASYTVKEVAPLEVPYDGRRIYCMPPPSSGGIALAQTFGILDHHPAKLSSLPQGQPGSIHLIAEAMNHAFADRARWLGDPDFVDIPLSRLISDSYLQHRAALISDNATLPVEKYGTGPDDHAERPTDGGTSHFSVIDARGNAVACTETINLEFGSLLCVREFGFPLNNQMDDFLTRPGQANAFKLTQSTRNLPAPGKRPLSSMSPTIAINQSTGEVELVVGASGGPRIISSTLQTALNALAYGMDAAHATAAPRLHTQWMPQTLWLEDALLTPENQDALTRMGHHVQGKAPQAACQIILRKDGQLQAACDPRKGGEPAGY